MVATLLYAFNDISIVMHTHLLYEQSSNWIYFDMWFSNVSNVLAAKKLSLSMAFVGF